MSFYFNFDLYIIKELNMNENIENIEEAQKLWLMSKLRTWVSSWYSRLITSWKQLFTWTIDQTKISWINKFIYFLSLTWIANIIYYSIFEEIEVYWYSVICIVLPIVISSFIIWNQKNSLWKLFQKIFFNDKEITIIFISSLLIFLFNLFWK